MGKKIPSRAGRFGEALGLIEQAKNIGEELQEELQDWLDNMPENLQQSSKAEELQEAIDQLDEFMSTADEAANTEVNFPGMYG